VFTYNFVPNYDQRKYLYYVGEISLLLYDTLEQKRTSFGIANPQTVSAEILMKLL
jgi:hypothetical protein